MQVICQKKKFNMGYINKFGDEINSPPKKETRHESPP